MDISIVIVSWNTREILYNCLQSVYDQTDDIPFEVIVIDNASTDSSVGMIRSEFPNVIVIENNENKGFAAANNQGIARALWNHVLNRSGNRSFSVNSSTYAVPAYERLGFKATDDPQAQDGLVFVPMAYQHDG